MGGEVRPPLQEEHGLYRQKKGKGGPPRGESVLCLIREKRACGLSGGISEAGSWEG